MLRKFTSTHIGLITGTLMLLHALFLYYNDFPLDTPLQYIAYFFYATGIFLAVLRYRQSPECSGKFADMFGQGFRAFIVVTLIMVSFTGIFSSMHPEFAQETSVEYRKDLEAKKDKTPAEIDTEVATFKKQYTIRLVSSSIFGYLFLGSVATALFTVIINKRN